MRRIKREPAFIISGVISALVILATSWGFELPEGAETGLQAVAAVVLALITRSQVRPVTPPAPPEGGVL